MSAAIVLQTQETSPAGLFEEWARCRGIALDVIRVDRWRSLPDPSGYDFAVALGSDESLVDPRADWVRTELSWIRSAHAASLPILGICFGAQALAVALGGSVWRLPSPEFAWIEVDTIDASCVPVGPWLALHEDAISPPPLAFELARNENGTQAFYVGRHLGVQFHPEATATLLARWVHDKRAANTPAPAALIAEAHKRARDSAAAAAELFDRFAAQAGVRSGETRLLRSAER